MIQGVSMTVGIIEKVQGVAAVGFSEELAARVVVGMLRTVDGLGSAKSIGVIGIADAVGAVGCACQPASLLPCEGPAGAVVVAGGVTDGIVGNALSIDCGQ